VLVGGKARSHAPCGVDSRRRPAAQCGSLVYPSPSCRTENAAGAVCWAHEPQRPTARASQSSRVLHAPSTLPHHRHGSHMRVPSRGGVVSACHAWAPGDDTRLCVYQRCIHSRSARLFDAGGGISTPLSCALLGCDAIRSVDVAVRQERSHAGWDLVVAWVGVFWHLQRRRVEGAGSGGIVIRAG
jgi:hypothetical protein